MQKTTLASNSLNIFSIEIQQASLELLLMTAHSTRFVNYFSSLSCNNFIRDELSVSSAPSCDHFGRHGE